MMKRGFTLIELMVVIVIIGILAAIAIPKLFGMTAKAKASEVGPAAGTWSKMEQAYKMETNSVGNWVSIGYKAPGTKDDDANSHTSNFSYKDNAPTSETKAEWRATAGKLSADCDGEVWTADFEAANESASNVVAGCEDLTPNFKKLQQ